MSRGRELRAPRGTELAAEKMLDWVLTTDPATDVMRRTDAGYGRADEVAAERGVRISMGGVES